MHPSRRAGGVVGATAALIPLSDLTVTAVPPGRATRRSRRDPRSTTRATGEQQAVIDALHAGVNTVVQARAGTGKTTTLVMASSELPYLRVLYLAYNNATAVDARKKFGRHVKCRTLHSLAYEHTPDWVRDRLATSRQNGRMVADILRITQPLVVSKGDYDMPIEARLQPQHVARLAMETLRRFCYSADDEVDWWHVPHQHGFTPEAQWQLARHILQHARRAWDDILTPKGRLRCEHDFYLKVWCAQDPQLPYDAVLLDEGQDSNPLTTRLISDQFDRQTAVIGDPEQQLYKWRGSVGSLDQFPDHTLLHLTQSWRFGPAVAEAGNVFLTLLGASPLVRGNPQLPSRLVHDMTDPDAVLCRTNGGAMSEVIALLAAEQPVTLQGGGEPIQRMAEAAIELADGHGTNHPELCAFSSWGEVAEYADNDPGGQDLRAFVRLIDNHGAEQVIAACEQLTEAPAHTAAHPVERGGPVVVSTIHKAKGLEWRKVRIANDMPTPRTDTATGHPVPIDPAEWMLAYVGCTRAQLDLDPGPLREWWTRRDDPAAAGDATHHQRHRSLIGDR